jgi:DNA polymerase III sliding clamp (beta) subunit (PCNA family)
MKLIFKTKELLEKLKNIAPTAEPKQTLVILGNVKVNID